MNVFDRINIKPGRAICYSGFRQGQQPGGIYPSYQQVKSDLQLLKGHWKYIRLYDVDQHGELVLDVIRKEMLPIKVMLGAYIEAEMNNFGCPWGGGVYTEDQLEKNTAQNNEKMVKLIQLANQYKDIVFSVSVGNEACVDWTDHYVSAQRVIEFVEKVKKAITQPITFCENYVPWLGKLRGLAESLDFISIHTYPVWEYKHIHEALDYTRENYHLVANMYPHKPVVITEAGWATNSNGRGIESEHVNEENQSIYYQDLMEWTEKEGILTFFFEAFDESWKGSNDPLEPEKHWGVFRENREPKMIIESLFFQNS